MNATVLQRQNLNLQTSLDQKRRDLEELQQKLERTEKRLLTQENAISVLDRHWEQTEQQATALLARVQDDEVAAADGAPGGLLGQLSAPKPLTPGELDAQLYPQPPLQPRP
jgi:DNA repair exonuclease SbcCD ATPase subunit